MSRLRISYSLRKMAVAEAQSGKIRQSSDERCPVSLPCGFTTAGTLKHM